MNHRYYNFRLDKLIHDLQGGALRFFDRRDNLLAHVRLLSKFSAGGVDTAEMDEPVGDVVLQAGTVTSFVLEDRYDEYLCLASVVDGPGHSAGSAMLFDERKWEVGGRVKIKTLQVTLSPGISNRPISLSKAPAVIVKPKPLTQGKDDGE
ncbi:hypothetical protein LCGC14_2077570 [marine sediment metagenome]|uniref:Uncharacterized protein n=1 Tax=marine sediment metagenome TaxID=412755 RepID=A0A0F9GUZ0_9ZZZZ